MTFSDTVLEYIHPGYKILDLGAGNGWFARKCLEHQAVVTAVDRQDAKEQHPDIDWRQMDVKEFLERLPEKEKYQVIFSRNLIQFLDSDWVREKLLPTLAEHLQPGGVIAIQTFYRDPEPAFESPLSSLYTANELRSLLQPMQILHEREHSEASPDMKGIPRKFFLTNIIAKK